MNKARRMRLPENSAYPKFHETHIEDAWCAQAGCIPVCPLPAEEFPIEVAPSRSAAPPSEREAFEKWRKSFNWNIRDQYRNLLMSRDEIADAAFTAGYEARAAVPQAAAGHQKHQRITFSLTADVLETIAERQKAWGLNASQAAERIILEYARAAAVPAPGRELLNRLRDGLTRMRDGDNLGPTARDMLKWLEQTHSLFPSATAPRTGEHFIAINFNGTFGVCGGREQPSVCVVHYWPFEGEEGFYPSLGPDQPFSFTHWEPLPEFMEKGTIPASVAGATAPPKEG